MVHHNDPMTEATILYKSIVFNPENTEEILSKIRSIREHLNMDEVEFKRKLKEFRDNSAFLGQVQFYCTHKECGHKFTSDIPLDRSCPLCGSNVLKYL